MRCWTRDEIRTVRDAGLAMTARELAAVLGRTERSVAIRRYRLRKYHAVYVHVTDGDWIAAVTAEARSASIPVGPCLGGDPKDRFAKVRWKAWRRLRALGATLPNLSTISGFHHATIIHGLRRLSEIESARPLIGLVTES